MTSDPDPMEPEEVGVEEKTPDAMQVEAAKKLAVDARERLHREGFDDEQIDEWARTFIAEEGDGDVETFVAWIDRRQGTDGA